MYKYCPHCGKAFLEPDEPRFVSIDMHSSDIITWDEIKKWSDNGEAAEHFTIGDEIRDTLKTGEEVTFVVVDRNRPVPGSVMFMLKDCLKDEYPMNEENTNAGGWKASALRRVLNQEIINDLPDDLRACIKPRVIDGESDMLWLASEMEIFGDQDWTEKDTDRGEQMPYYKRRGNRCKALGQGSESADGWWERSPFTSSSALFCFVYSNGVAFNSGASNSYGVAFGFCI